VQDAVTMMNGRTQGKCGAGRGYQNEQRKHDGHNECKRRFAAL